MNYLVSIGLEVHVELSTQSKLFCGCSTKFGMPPNTQSCPVCLGLPGVLPVINKKAVEYAISTALALHSKVNQLCRFARKNYYYPDLPKNYQISQYKKPLAINGYLEFEVENKLKKVDIERIHLEEDAGKLIHGEARENLPEKELSFIDYNRTGIPLMEIVTSPTIYSPQEAYQYLIDLKRIIKYLRVSNCNMEEGSLRCDANISLAPEGERRGTKAELKNMNSFKEIREGLGAEIKRQSYLLDKGEKVMQETRLWDAEKKRTRSMRSKEEAHDYRYFPEPDLLPLEIDKKWQKELKAKIPELPQERRQRFIIKYGLPPYDAGVLTESRDLADYFEECLKSFPYSKQVSNWIMGEFLRLVKKENVAIDKVKATPAQTGELLNYLKKGTISGKLAKLIFEEMFKTGKEAEGIIEARGLKQITDETSLEKVIEEVLRENSQGVNDFKAGKEKALGYLVGQIMKKTKGKASPRLVNRLLREKIDNLP